MSEEENKDAPFNMAMMYYIELHQLRQLKSRAVIENNIYAYYDCLEEIYISISFKLTKEQKTKLETKFKEAYDFLKTNIPGSLALQIQSLTLIEAKKILKDIDMELITLMDKYKMIFPKIESGIGLDKLKKKYGL